MRIDIAETLAGITPTVWRWPGGNNLEGSVVDKRWKWNESVIFFVSPLRLALCLG